MRLLIVLVALLAGCASERTSPPAPVAEPGPPVSPPPTTAEPARPAAPTESVAVAGLMQGARADSAAGELGKAAAKLERAFRIEPRNPRVLRDLARVRLQQGEYAQAEQMALKSNSFAGADNSLRAENWRLIAQTREARGNTEGARTALETAERIGR